MIITLKNHMHDQQLETCWKFAEMHSMKGFENIIVQWYDWRIYKYKVSTILKIQYGDDWSTQASEFQLIVFDWQNICSDDLFSK